MGIKKGENGYALRIQRLPNSVARIEKLLELEQRCCSFLSFSHEVVSSTEVELRVTGLGRFMELGARLLGLKP